VEHEEIPSKKLIIFGLLLTLSFILLSTYMLYLGIVPLIKSLYLSEPFITLEKSFYYCLGVLITLIGGFINIVLYKVVGLPLQHRYAKPSTMLFYIGIILFFIFPQTMYFSLDYYLENKKGYHYCKELSTIKLALTKYVYTQSPELCATEEKTDPKLEPKNNNLVFP